MTSNNAETQPGEATRIGSRTSRAAADLSSQRGKNLALMLLAMTQFVVVIDASIVNVALPSIGSHLHFSRDDLSWVVNAYTLTFGGFLLLGGRLADLLGRRRMFMIGLVVFSLASLAGGLAQSEAWLIAARAVQGLGAAIVSPAALSIITTTFAEGAERNRALGIWGAVAGAGARRRGAVGRHSHERSELAVGVVRERTDRHRPGDGRSSAVA
jgi:sugar phosphate permease